RHSRSLCQEHKKNPRFSKLPDAFDGDKNRCQEFFSQVDLYIEINAEAYTYSVDKVRLVGSLLTGNAAHWFFSHREDDPRFRDFTQFKEFFFNSFDDHDRELVAANKITSIKQGRRDVNTYATEFLTIKRNLTWDESPLMHHFKKGLS